MSEWVESIVTHTVELTDEMDQAMAHKHWHEKDGSVWSRLKERAGWRWQPLNWQAFGKGEPDSEMSDTYLPPDFADIIARR